MADKNSKMVLKSPKKQNNMLYSMAITWAAGNLRTSRRSVPKYIRSTRSLSAIAIAVIMNPPFQVIISEIAERNEMNKLYHSVPNKKNY